MVSSSITQSCIRGKGPLQRMILIFGTQILCPLFLNFSYNTIPPSQDRSPKPHSLACVCRGRGCPIRTEREQERAVSTWQVYRQCLKVCLLFTAKIFAAKGQWRGFPLQVPAVSVGTAPGYTLQRPSLWHSQWTVDHLLKVFFFLFFFFWH